MSEIVRFRQWQGRRTQARVHPWTMPSALLLAAVIAVCCAVGYFAQDLGVLRLGWGGDFALCLHRNQQNCVVDGDTIRFHGETIRLADIDAPETREPRCAAEAVRGARATRRLLELMNDGPFTVTATKGDDTDRYGRKLRRIERNGVSLGELLVAEGLARRLGGVPHRWCG